MPEINEYKTFEIVTISFAFLEINLLPSYNL